MAQQHNGRYKTENHVGGDQYHINVGVAQMPQIEYESRKQAPPSLSFNNAPINRLSLHCIGREKELGDIGKVFDIRHGSAPTRCIIYGMPGMGKTQLALQYAKSRSKQYSVIFWISATTVEKLYQGFSRVLTLVGHPGHDHPDHEDTACVAGEQCQTFIALQTPNITNAANQLLQEAGISAEDAAPASRKDAETLVKHVMCLPLAISHVASVAKRFSNNLEKVLNIYDKYKPAVIGWENIQSCHPSKSVAIIFGRVGTPISQF